MEKQITTLEDLINRGLVITSRDFAAQKQPDDRVRIILTRQLKIERKITIDKLTCDISLGTIEMTFRVKADGVYVTFGGDPNCHMDDTGSPFTFEADGLQTVKSDIIFEFDLPDPGASGTMLMDLYGFRDPAVLATSYLIATHSGVAGNGSFNFGAPRR